MQNRWSARLITHPPKIARRHYRMSLQAKTSDFKLHFAEVIADPAFWHELLESYLTQQFLPEMGRVWRQATANEAVLPHPVNYAPPAIVEDASGALSQEEAAALGTSTRAGYDPYKFRPAFDALLEALRTSVSRTSSSGATVELGPYEALLSLKMSDFMPTPGHTTSPYNTLFYGVEYGTGALAGSENGAPGDPSFIRGPEDDPRGTKDTRPEFRGTWWLQAPNQTYGLHMKGQAGVHFLFDAHTRQPKARWVEFVDRTFLPFARAYVEENRPEYLVVR